MTRSQYNTLVIMHHAGLIKGISKDNPQHYEALTLGTMPTLARADYWEERSEQRGMMLWHVGVDIEEPGSFASLGFSHASQESARNGLATLITALSIGLPVCIAAVLAQTIKPPAEPAPAPAGTTN